MRFISSLFPQLPAPHLFVTTTTTTPLLPLRSDFPDVLRQITSELNAALFSGLESSSSIDLSEDEGSDNFKTTVTKITQPVVIIIDGLDKLQNLGDLTWLPREFPPNVRVILTTSPGPGEFVAQRLKLPTARLEPFNDEERGQFVSKYFGMVSPSLSPSSSFLSLIPSPFFLL